MEWMNAKRAAPYPDTTVQKGKRSFTPPEGVEKHPLREGRRMLGGSENIGCYLIREPGSEKFRIRLEYPEPVSQRPERYAEKEVGRVPIVRPAASGDARPYPPRNALQKSWRNHRRIFLYDSWHAPTIRPAAPSLQRLCRHSGRVSGRITGMFRYGS